MRGQRLIRAAQVHCCHGRRAGDPCPDVAYHQPLHQSVAAADPFLYSGKKKKPKCWARIYYQIIKLKKWHIVID